MTAAPRPVGETELLAFVDGELEAWRMREIEQHLLRDSALAARADQWRRQNDAVRAAFGRVTGEPVPASLGVRRDGQRPPAAMPPAGPAPIRLTSADRDRALRVRRERQTRAITATVLSFIAGGIVTVTASTLIGQTPALVIPAVSLSPPAFPDAARRLGLRALETHATYTARRAAADMPLIAPVKAGEWLRDILRVDVPLPDLQIEDLQLAGARLTPAEQGPALWLLYEGKQDERIAIFVTRLAAADSPPRYEDDGRSGAIFWTSAGLGMAITGQRDRERLAQVATAVRASLLLGR
jgi:anti-sigma factor RsiW